MRRCGICGCKKQELTYEYAVGTVPLLRRLLVCLSCDFNGRLPTPRK